MLLKFFLIFVIYYLGIYYLLFIFDWRIELFYKQHYPLRLEDLAISSAFILTRVVMIDFAMMFNYSDDS